MAAETSTSYQAIPIILHPESTAVRHIYIRLHAGQDNLPKDRALFVVGLPIEFNEDALVQLFSKFGELERAAIHGSGLSAVVLYDSAKGVSKAQRAATKGRPIQLNVQRSEGPYGLKRWVEIHKALKPGNAQLQQQLDEWTEAYEEEEQRRKEEALRAMEDDGWTVVQRHKGRKKNVSATGVTVGAVAANAALSRKEKKQETVHTDFYRFQQRDRRRNGESACLMLIFHS